MRAQMPTCVHTHKPARIIWLQTFRGSFSKTAAALNLRNVTNEIAVSEERPGVGFGQYFCSCQGDLKARFTLAFPGILTQLMQVGSRPGIPQKSLQFLL